MTQRDFEASTAHSAIIYRAGGPAAVVARLETTGLKVRNNTVSGWVIRNSIPSKYWPRFERAGIASIEALDNAYFAQDRARQEARRSYGGHSASPNFTGTAPTVATSAAAAAMGALEPFNRGEEV